MGAGLHFGLAGVSLLFPTVLLASWMNSASHRLTEAEAAPTADAGAPVASAADEGYCTADIKKVLRRVLMSCGLAGAGGGRGCAPMEAKNVATMAGDDFNALFLPLASRAGIIQFDKNSTELDPNDLGLIDKLFADRRGASYFLVVSRSSPEGSVDHNRELSEQRGQGVLGHLETTFEDPDLNKQVGLLSLGEEYAQLNDGFCSWQRSGEVAQCNPEDLNRSTFVAWIDCTL